MTYKFGYVLNVEGPFRDISGFLFYKDKETGELHSGWYHCGCCGRDGFMSVNTPTCTGCANKINHGSDDSPRTIEEIEKYIDWINSVCSIIPSTS